MLDLALQLEWKGKDEVYEGESKNVALLYEYWLFFELYKIVKSIEGCTAVKTQEDPFLLLENGITISLEEGKKSCQSFQIKRHGVKINQRIIAGNAQFTGIAAGRGVGFTTGLLLLREGLGMRETPIRPHSWH